MKYYNICLDDTDYLYLGRNSKLNVQFCPYCGMILNREALISQAAATLKWRNKTFFATTYDGVSIVNQQFYDIYHNYEMKGIEFIPFKKSEGYYICNFINTVSFDLEKAKQIRVEYEGKVTYGVIDNGTCDHCKKSKGHHHPWPYRMIESDEQNFESNTFYRSDIEFGENNYQAPLIWGTEGIVETFDKEKSSIFYRIVE